ncbi:MAG: cytochrome ubiquinol oxidase subunit I [Fibrobacteria bacterium]|nr:cytochrome ubiquinol oxidase subunit I [Fibrobacteria bacterium]
MNYPAWDVPYLGSGWMIGIVAIIHILISHFAVGGGIFLPLTEAKALREGRKDWMLRLKGYSKFFLVLTGVFGAMTGVGIWFAIGLASPNGTSALIHNFVFGWAIEWVFFLVELTLAMVYYYTWDRIPAKLHLTIGWIYAAVSWGTLVIINGILTFKLTPGPEWMASVGTGRESEYFFDAFFNAGYLPSLGLRTLACLSLAGIWSLYFFSRLDGESDGKTKASMVQWSSMFLIPSFLLMPVFFAWYVFTIPADHRALLELGISSASAGTFTHVTRMTILSVVSSATIALAVMFFAWFQPTELKRGHALSILFLALLATGSTESVREFLRKPFVVNGYMYSNGVRVNQIEGFNRDGYLTGSVWSPVSPDAAFHHKSVGERMFQGQCMACHTLDGYRPIRKLLAGRDTTSIGSVLKMLHDNAPESPYRKFMPPLVGTEEEIRALRDWLAVQVAPASH